MADELDAALARVESKARGRTRYEGQPPYDDELMLTEITRLRTQLALKDKALREVEWSAFVPYDPDNGLYGSNPGCPSCGKSKPIGHAPDCVIAKALSPSMTDAK